MYHKKGTYAASYSYVLVLSATKACEHVKSYPAVFSRMHCGLLIYSYVHDCFIGTTHIRICTHLGENVGLNSTHFVVLCF